MRLAANGSSRPPRMSSIRRGEEQSLDYYLLYYYERNTERDSFSQDPPDHSEFHGCVLLLMRRLVRHEVRRALTQLRRVVAVVELAVLAYGNADSPTPHSTVHPSIQSSSTTSVSRVRREWICWSENAGGIFSCAAHEVHTFDLHPSIHAAQGSRYRRSTYRSIDRIISHGPNGHRRSRRTQTGRNLERLAQKLNGALEF